MGAGLGNGEGYKAPGVPTPREYYPAAPTPMRARIMPVPTALRPREEAVFAPEDKTLTYVALGGIALVAVGGVYWLMTR